MVIIDPHSWWCPIMRKKLTLQTSLAAGKRYGGWALGLLTLLVVLACAGCLRVGDYELSLGGVASKAGSVGYEVNGRLLSVDVEAGETAEEIGPRLPAVMKAEGLAVECQLYDGERYYFILRDVREPVHKPEALGVTTGHCGPLQDDRMLIEVMVTWFYENLNANNQAGVSARTTEEFRQEALDVMASMAASGEQISIESLEELTVDCYQATVCLHLIRLVGTEQQPVDTCLTLTRPSPCEMWMVSGGVIR
ncbi:MAG: hypothetical protein E3J65_04640 [Dehalococcoidia bacterium]|nr:MAG: hypothetical protein E3J65_04640 [Dehalococcoidia bacterium]